MINFATQFYDGGIWKEENEEMRLTIYILTFCAFLVNLPPYVAGPSFTSQEWCTFIIGPGRGKHE